MIEINFQDNPICVINHNEIPTISRHFSSWKGLADYAAGRVKSEEKPVSKYADVKKLLLVAEDWIGKDFKPGQKEQCCYFVRNCLFESGLKAGVTLKPSDGLSTGEGYANSLAGDDIGQKIENSKDLLPGDLVFFKNTYGNWPDGTITHVGIYTGNGYFVHRPTSARPVEKAYLENYGHFCEGRRLLK